MKVRKGFVSNSSSSSFVCVVCGNVESGYDASAADCGFYVCENGHEFCQEHVLPGWTDHEDFSEYEDVPAEFCPICQLKAISDDDLIKFMLKRSGQDRKDVVAQINLEFANFGEFRNYLKGK